MIIRKCLNKFLLIIILLGSNSCIVSEFDPQLNDNDQTVLMYFPWSDDLTSYFYQNINDLESEINKNLLDKERVLILLATSQTEATLFELIYDRGKTIRGVHKKYYSPEFTTSKWITALLNDVKLIAPANRYAMIIGGHGMGWLPVPETDTYSNRPKYHWEYTGDSIHPTRFFGGTTIEYQTNISTLAEGISNAGIKMEYILFDDCYMSSIEVAYDLKDVTDYLIASPTEIMSYGFPYHQIAPHLIGDIDYENISHTFYEFYKNYPVTPYGTIGITKTNEIDDLVFIMKEINRRHNFNPLQINSIQRLDGYTPVIFFDLADYVSKLCTDDLLLSLFNKQLERTVPLRYRKHTNKFYSVLQGEIEIRTFSGITISDLSVNSLAITKTETAWYKATH